MNKQSFFTILLAMLMSMVGIKAAHAFKIKNADGVPINYEWINNNTELAVSCYYEWDNPCNEYSGNVVIPESVVYDGKTYRVTSIHAMAFFGCRGLTSVTIPNSVTTIDGDEAFARCFNLTSITIPNSVTFIDTNCFEDTPWYKNQPDGLIYAGKVAYRYKGKMPANTHIDLKEGTLGISPRAFGGCSGLISVNIPSSVINIGYDAFKNTSITSLIIPKSVTSIKGNAFIGCSSLASIQVESDNQYYDSRNNCNAIIDSNNQLIIGCKNTIIPSSVTSIGNSAFSGCTGLTSITIPNSVTSIGYGAFMGCSGLTSIAISNSVTSIDYEAFSGCSGLTSITIPNSVTSIEGKAFRGCSGLTSIEVESGNMNYDSRNNCNAIIDNNNQLILGCKNTIIPNSVTSIGDDAFSDCSGLTSINIPQNVTSIGDGAFWGCSGMVYVTLPSNLTSIGSNSFDYCNSLTDIYCKAVNVPDAFYHAFSNPENITLHVPYESLNAYQTTEPWNKFKNYESLSSNDLQASEKCSKPTISIVDGKLVINCETPGANSHWSISTPSGTNGQHYSVSSPIALNTITLNVFATKSGYLPSDVTIYEFSGIVGDVDGNGVVNVADHVKLSNIILNQNK